MFARAVIDATGAGDYFVGVFVAAGYEGLSA